MTTPSARRLAIFPTRRFRGNADEPALEIVVDATGEPSHPAVQVRVTSRDAGRAHALTIRDRSYGHQAQLLMLPIAGSGSCSIDAVSSHGWYDFIVESGANANFFRGFAGRMELGTWSYTDSMIGAVTT